MLACLRRTSFSPADLDLDLDGEFADDSTAWHLSAAVRLLRLRRSILATLANG
jgi:hypothetical protein